MQTNGQPHALAALTMQKELTAKLTIWRVAGKPVRIAGVRAHYAARVTVCLSVSQRHCLPTAQADPITPSTGQSAADNQFCQFRVQLLAGPLSATLPTGVY